MIICRTGRSMNKIKGNVALIFACLIFSHSVFAKTLYYSFDKLSKDRLPKKMKVLGAKFTSGLEGEGAIEFDGEVQLVYLGPLHIKKSFKVEFSFKAKKIRASGYLVDSPSQFSIWLDDRELKFAVYDLKNGPSVVSLKGVTPYKQRVNVVASYNHQKQQVCIGEKGEDAICISALIKHRVSGSPLYLGQSPRGSHYQSQFIGILDELRVWH